MRCPPIFTWIHLPGRSAQLAAGLASALIADHSRYILVKNTQFYTAYFPAAERRRSGGGVAAAANVHSCVTVNRYLKTDTDTDISVTKPILKKTNTDT